MVPSSSSRPRRLRARLVSHRHGSGRYRKRASAVADFVGKSPSSQPLGVEFSDVVRSDLDYSGILELVSKSFNPLQTPGAPAEVDYKAWTDAPASTQLLAFGNLVRQRQ